MSRTNVDIDDELIARVMRIYGLKTKREAVDFALHKVAERKSPHKLALELHGSGWEGDLEAMRESRVVDL